MPSINKDEARATAVEYGLTAAALSVVAIAVVTWAWFGRLVNTF